MCKVGATLPVPHTSTLGRVRELGTGNSDCVTVRCTEASGMVLGLKNVYPINPNEPGYSLRGKILTVGYGIQSFNGHTCGTGKTAETIPACSTRITTELHISESNL